MLILVHSVIYEVEKIREFVRMNTKYWQPLDLYGGIQNVDNRSIRQ